MRRRDRGMVTAETAIASLALSLVVAALVALFGVLLVQVRCTDSAHAIARQASRGDTVAVARLSRDVPRGAVVTVDRPADGTVVVTVTATVRPVPGVPVTATLVGRAVAPLEPGLS